MEGQQENKKKNEKKRKKNEKKTQKKRNTPCLFQIAQKNRKSPPQVSFFEEN